MKPYQINVINALILIAMGLWGYFSSDNPSATALIAPGFGVVFLLLTPLFKADNKIVAHLVVLLTFALIFALIKPLTAALGRSDTMAIVRVSLMLLSCVVATIAYIKSFIDIRRNRAA